MLITIGVGVFWLWRHLPNAFEQDGAEGGMVVMLCAVAVVGMMSLIAFLIHEASEEVGKHEKSLSDAKKERANVVREGDKETNGHAKSL